MSRPSSRGLQVSIYRALPRESAPDDLSVRLLSRVISERASRGQGGEERVKGGGRYVRVPSIARGRSGRCLCLRHPSAKRELVFADRHFSAVLDRGSSGVKSISVRIGEKFYATGRARRADGRAEVYVLPALFSARNHESDGRRRRRRRLPSSL